MAVTILTDSTSDISPQEAARRGLKMVSLRVAFGDTVYRDNVDITHEEFYEKLTQSVALPTTSQPTPEDFLSHFEEARDKGDQLVCLLLSGRLSGTVQSALIAKDLCGYDDIYVVDSLQAVIGLRALVDLACILRDEGRSAAEIAAELESARQRMRMFAVVDTLEYLHKGGRLPAAAAVAGTLLKVKPLITLQDGSLSVIGKAMGSKAALKQLTETLGDELNADPRLPIYFGYTCTHDICDRFRALVEEKYHPDRTEIHSVGAVIGTHLGPGASVVGFLEQA